MPQRAANDSSRRSGNGFDSSGAAQLLFADHYQRARHLRSRIRYVPARALTLLYFFFPNTLTKGGLTTRRSAAGAHRGESGAAPAGRAGLLGLRAT
jgi:hypothetical protein